MTAPGVHTPEAALMPTLGTRVRSTLNPAGPHPELTGIVVGHGFVLDDIDLHLDRRSTKMRPVLLVEHEAGLVHGVYITVSAWDLSALEVDTRCPDMVRDGSCIHSEHMTAAGM